MGKAHPPVLVHSMYKSYHRPSPTDLKDPTAFLPPCRRTPATPFQHSFIADHSIALVHGLSRNSPTVKNGGHDCQQRGHIVV
ncbi:hypothetical protein BRADI_4g04413v3 [Brachypodium distachyon]|uniref:Uncharacterized protein n=1 Tax=Brachypodium distachyon TaxID=15368 RepID=A0A2K2CKE3_BRADI|nr:hypothetical protein BRADI_4g04413v3 [Brachypodium distachyon]